MYSWRTMIRPPCRSICVSCLSNSKARFAFTSSGICFAVLGGRLRLLVLVVEFWFLVITAVSRRMPPLSAAPPPAIDEFQSVVCCVRFSTDGTKIAAGSHSCVKVFDVTTFKQLYVCRKVGGMMDDLV